MDAADPALFADRVAVVSRPETAARAAARGFRVVINDRPADGLSRTVRLGTEALADCDGILYLVADQPQLTAETVARVVDRWRLAPDRMNDKGYNPAEVTNQASCIGCAMCGIICPDSAITVEK